MAFVNAFQSFFFDGIGNGHLAALTYGRHFKKLPNQPNRLLQPLLLWHTASSFANKEATLKS